MSFILDALKKSESDRQRQTGPALFEVKVAPPRTRLPTWAIAIAALLVVNLGIVMWMVLRHQSATPPPAATAGSAAAGAPPAASAYTGPASTGPASAGSPAIASQPAPAATTPVPAGAAPSAAGPSATVAATPASAMAPATPAAALTAGASALAGGGAANPAGSPADPRGAGNGESNPDDYAPAQEAPPAAAGSSFGGGHVRRGTAAGVPLYQEAAATGGAQLPQLRLDLHVYAQRPQDRFVMINMHKLREGDSLPEGVHVDNITPEGAVLSFNGSRFLLPRE